MFGDCGVVVKGVNVATFDCLVPLIATFIYWLIVFSGFIAAFFIILGGIRFITSGGDSKKVDESRKTITFAILGLILVFLSFFVLTFLSYTTRVACLNPNSPLTFTNCGGGGRVGGGGF